MTLTEIKENNLRCVIKVDSKEEAVKLFEIFNPNGYDANYDYDYLTVNYWKGDGTVCFGVIGNTINGFDTETYYKKNEEQYGKIYRFKDLIAKEGIVGAFKGTPVYADGRTLRMADGTIIGEFNTGDTLPTSEWSKLVFKNSSSIEVLPQKDDTVRGENHFCTGFRGGKIPTPEKPVSIEEQLGLPKGVSIHDLDMTSLYRPMNIEIQPLELVCSEEKAKELAERLNKELAGRFNAFPNNGISAKNGGKNSMKFTFYTIEGYRIDKSNNTKIPTVTTEVVYKDKDGCATGGSATCDKADYSERDGILNAIANAVLGGNFDREYEKFLADKKRKYDKSCKCKICGRNYYEDEKTGKRTPFTPEDARKHEEWHEQNKKNKREKYLIRKEAKRRLAEAEREGKIEQTMKELYKK